MSRFQSQVYSKSSQLTKKAAGVSATQDLLELAEYVDRFIETFNNILWILSSHYLINNYLMKFCR